MLSVSSPLFAARYGYLFKQTDTSLLAKKSFDVFYTYMAKTIRYPRYARESGTTGAVIVSFKLNTDGKIEDVVTIKSVKNGCDEEVKNTLLAFNDKNKQIKSGDYTVAVIFRFEGQAIPEIDPAIKTGSNYLSPIIVTGSYHTGMRRF